MTGYGRNSNNVSHNISPSTITNNLTTTSGGSLTENGGNNINSSYMHHQVLSPIIHR